VVTSAGKEREQLRLEQRTAEADKAKAELVIASADRVRDQSSLRQKIAETARARADLAAANVGRGQDQLLLNQKTAEVNQARLETGIAQNQAMDAQIMSAEAEARTRQLEAMLAGLAARETERGMVVTLNDVLFNVDQSQLKPDGMRNVQKLSEFMKQYPQRTVLIEGYTDSTGNSAHNMDLSNRRAEAVRAALESMGVARERMETRGYGEAYPIADNDTQGNRQMNRRVEIILSGENGRVAGR
jgi:outer membrane protein OmpA-like peptidoglycan-associated protein